MKKLLLLAVLAIGLITCKKEKVNPPASPSATISSQKTSATTHEVVMIDVKNYTLAEAAYDAGLGAAVVKTVRVNDTTLAFVMPEGISGNADFQISFAANSVSFTVTQPEPVTNPEQYVGEFMGDFNKELSVLLSTLDSMDSRTESEKNILRQDIQKVKDNYQKYQADFAALSVEEKQNCADFIKANREQLDKTMAAVGQLAGINSGLRADDECASETTKLRRAVCYTLKFTFAVAELGKWAGITVAAGAVSTGINPALGIVVAGGFVGLKLAPAFVEAVDAGYRLVTFPFKPEEIAEVTAMKKTEEFSNETPRPLSVKVNYRNVQEGDGGTAGKIISAFKRLQKLYDDDWKAKWFTSRPELPSKAVVSSEPEVTEYLSLDVDNSKVNGKLAGNPTGLTVTFTTDESTGQNFNFTVSYNDGETSIRSQQINAVVLPVTYEVTLESGDMQNWHLSMPLPKPLVVKVMGSNGKPYQGAKVEWINYAGDGTFSPLVSYTGSDGLASTTWTLDDKTLSPIAKAIVTLDGKNHIPGSPVVFMAFGKDVDSSEIYEQSMIGKYTVTRDQNDVGTTYCELSANGTAKYTVYNNPSWPDGYAFNATWMVKKQDGKYFYWESGFYHPGFPNIDVTHPLKYPVSGFIFHINTNYTR